MPLTRELVGPAVSEQLACGPGGWVLSMAIGNEGRDLLVYLLLFLPLEFIMTSKRVIKDGNRKKAVAVAGSILAVVASVKIGVEVLHKDRSYYDMMGVRPNAPLTEIKKGYRAESLKVRLGETWHGSRHFESARF